MCLNKFLSTDSFHDNLLMGIEICGEQTLKLIVCEDGFVNKRFLYFFDVIECRFCDFSLGNIILDIEIITAESLDLRDKKDGTYTALPGATLYELYGENWREESGYSGNPADLQVGDVVGKVNIPKEYTDTQPETIHNMTDTNNSNIVRSYGFGLKMALVLGLGFEVGYVTDGETKAIYITGSYGIGVQVSTGNYSSIEELMNSYKNPSNLFSPSIGSGSVTSGTETSETVDIGVGVVGTWDLNNLDKSGLPNSWSAGSVGGGYWYNSTTVFKIGRDKK